MTSSSWRITARGLSGACAGRDGESTGTSGRVAAVILTYNIADVDGDCVSSLSDHEAPLASVIVADNALLSTGLRYRSAMPDVRAVEVKPITDADIRSVAEFLHRETPFGVSAADWCRVMTPPWDVEQPNHGYLLRENGRVVGAYLALYSERVIDGRPRRICNLGAWCVADEHRATGLRMLRSLLRQREYTFTDLSPNPNVVALNTRLGFAPLDTTTVLVPNMPWPVRSRGVRVVDTPNAIDGLLSGRDQKIYRDHCRDRRSPRRARQG